MPHKNIRLNTDRDWIRLPWIVAMERLRLASTGYGAALEKYGESHQETLDAIEDLKDAANYVYFCQYPRPVDDNDQDLPRQAGFIEQHADREIAQLKKLRNRKAVEKALP